MIARELRTRIGPGGRRRCRVTIEAPHRALRCTAPKDATRAGKAASARGYLPLRPELCRPGPPASFQIFPNHLAAPFLASHRTAIAVLQIPAVAALFEIPVIEAAGESFVGLSLLEKYHRVALGPGGVAVDPDKVVHRGMLTAALDRLVPALGAGDEVHQLLLAGPFHGGA